MLRCLCHGLLVLYAMSGLGCTPRPVSFGLTLATFNVSNLGTTSSAAKRSAIAAIVETTQADVVLLEEVQGPAALDDFAAETSVGEHFPYRVALPGNDLRGFGLVLLSRLEVSRVVSHASETFSLEDSVSSVSYVYARDCLEAHFAWEGSSLVLLGVHFRAQLADDPGRRLAEAEHTRRLADDLLAADPRLQLVVLGDFNDVPGSPPLKALEGAETGRLLSVASVLSEGERWSLPAESGQGPGQLFDDLLVNAPLRAALRVASVTILHDSDLPDELRWASDHAPVAASFGFGQSRADW